MRSKGFIFLLAAVLVILALTACGQGQSSTPPGSSAAATGYASLTAFLRTQGVTMVDDGTVSQSFFSVQGRRAKVNGDSLQVYEYSSPAAAAAEAKFVQPDGSTIMKGNQVISVDWIAPPHFFLSGRMIVIYIGQDETILRLLNQQLGNQFAGR